MAANRTYRAATMREAMALVRRDLGGDAVILGTREVRRRRLFGLGAREVVEVTASDGRPEAVAVRAPQVAPAGAPAGFGDELRRLHAMVEALTARGRVDHLVPDVPTEAVPSYAMLVEAGTPEALARRLARRVAERLGPEDVGRPERAIEHLAEEVEACLAIAPPTSAVPGVRRVVALIGPTGVGKTTTVAKLAASFKLSRGHRPGLVTVDTYRIAAVEQLRTYAEIIDLPLAVANAPGEMAGAVERLGDVDIVLIDTAGRGPRDEVKVRELADFLAEARPDEVHLVLSAATAERGLRAAVERFGPVHPDRLILTKLDEAEGLGGLLALFGQTGLPVSYLTTGQAVPDDIEPADRGRLARLILGLESPS